MDDREALFLLPAGAFLLYMLFNQGGFEIFTHPIIAGTFLFVFFTTIYFIVKIFEPKKRSEDKPKKETKILSPDQYRILEKNKMKYSTLCAILDEKGMNTPFSELPDYFLIKNAMSKGCIVFESNDLEVIKRKKYELDNRVFNFD